jgi:hypothetical protein
MKNTADVTGGKSIAVLLQSIIHKCVLINYVVFSGLSGITLISMGKLDLKMNNRIIIKQIINVTRLSVKLQVGTYIFNCININVDYKVSFYNISLPMN